MSLGSHYKFKAGFFWLFHYSMNSKKWIQSLEVYLFDCIRIRTCWNIVKVWLSKSNLIILEFVGKNYHFQHWTHCLSWEVENNGNIYPLYVSYSQCYNGIYFFKLVLSMYCELLCFREKHRERFKFKATLCKINIYSLLKGCKSYGNWAYWIQDVSGQHAEEPGGILDCYRQPIHSYLICCMHCIQLKLPANFLDSLTVMFLPRLLIFMA